MLPGVYSVIVPSLSVVVVVVVVLEVCAQANGAATASAMLRSVFFISSFRLMFFGRPHDLHLTQGGTRLPSSQCSKKPPRSAAFPRSGMSLVLLEIILRRWTRNDCRAAIR